MNYTPRSFGIFRNFSGFFGIFRDFSGFFGIERCGWWRRRRRRWEKSSDVIGPLTLNECWASLPAASSALAGWIQFNLIQFNSIQNTKTKATRPARPAFPIGRKSKKSNKNSIAQLIRFEWIRINFKWISEFLRNDALWGSLVLFSAFFGNPAN